MPSGESRRSPRNDGERRAAGYPGLLRLAGRTVGYAQGALAEVVRTCAVGRELVYEDTLVPRVDRSHGAADRPAGVRRRNGASHRQVGCSGDRALVAGDDQELRVVREFSRSPTKRPVFSSSSSSSTQNGERLDQVHGEHHGHRRLQALPPDEATPTFSTPACGRGCVWTALAGSQAQRDRTTT